MICDFNASLFFNKHDFYHHYFKQVFYFKSHLLVNICAYLYFEDIEIYFTLKFGLVKLS